LDGFGLFHFAWTVLLGRPTNCAVVDVKALEAVEAHNLISHTQAVAVAG
jgi:hypothetical protein